ncbi:hypothetical protein HGO38_05905 [Rhizobium sp. CG5]|uniref:hypothetical protein n=1 Tax=Rhizobium sp. CG5 TaxID=2726076 RepID=UPI002033A043|nr:hypothetical protein [Rhizobium sp. CG5]MCM2473009.1 hypothetical protein [Rhizobium sp. CG5]
MHTAAACPAPGSVKSTSMAAPAGNYPNVTFKNSSYARLTVYQAGDTGSYSLIGVVGPGEAMNSGGTPTVGEKYLVVDPDGRCLGGALEKDPGNDLTYALFGDATLATPGLSTASLTQLAACPTVGAITEPVPAGQAANVAVENKTGAPIDIVRIMPNGSQFTLMSLADQKSFNTGGAFGPAVRLLAKTASGQCVGGIITAINQRATTVTLAASLGTTTPPVATDTVADVLNETVTAKLACPAAGTVASKRGSGSHAVSFINKTSGPLSVIWLHYDGSRTTPHALPAGYAVTMGGFGGMDQAYLVIDQSGNCFGGVLKPKAARQTQYTLQ